MKNKASLLTLLLLLIYCHVATAQLVQLSNVKVDKLENLKYIATSGKYHFFSSTKQMIHRFNRGDMSLNNTIEYELDNKNEIISSKYIIGERLIIVTKLYETSKAGGHNDRINVYEFDPSNGSKIKLVSTGGPSENSIYYNSYHDTAAKQIVLVVNDSIVNLLDYKLQPVAFEKGAKYVNPNKVYSTLFYDLEDLLSSLNLKFSITTDIVSSGKTVKPLDSFSTKHFVVKYEKKEDKDIQYFNKFFSLLSIQTLNKDSKVKDVDFAIDNDKVIIDMDLREDKSGSLIIYGKYIIKGSRYAQYGMFSAKYDQMLNQVSPLKYYDLASTEIDEKVVPNVKNIGLFYTRLNYAKHTFEMEDGTLLQIYQKEYSNVKDHIYILKVEPSGELIINVIPSHIAVDKKNTFATEKFIPVLLKDKLVFIMYENQQNLDKSMNDINIYWCDPNDKASALVYCYYDITNDEVRKKKLISDNESLKPIPHLADYSLFYDRETGEYLCFLPGENKKNVSKVLYQITLSY